MRYKNFLVNKKFHQDTSCQKNRFIRTKKMGTILLSSLKIDGLSNNTSNKQA